MIEGQTAPRKVSIAFRLPVDIYAIILERAKRKRLKPSEYLRKKTIYEATRTHGKQK